MQPINVPSTVFAVDDEPALLSWIQSLVKSMSLPVEIFNSPLDFLARITPDRSGCLVLDVRMPQMTGPELQSEMIRREIHLPIIFLSSHGDIPMALQAIRNGAFDFLEKPVRDNVLLERIMAALRHDQQRRAKESTREALQARMRSLTDREHDVLRLIIQGNPNKVIASELQISEKTVEYRRKAIMTKLEVNSLAQLVQITLMLEGKS